MKQLLNQFKMYLWANRVRLVFLAILSLFMAITTVVPSVRALAQGGEMPPLEAYWQFLVTYVVAGLGIIEGTTKIITQIKTWLNLEGAVVKWMAVGLATVFGTLVLYFFSPFGYPVVFLDYFARAMVAFMFAFMAPFAYEYQKQTAKSGMESAIKDMEAKAVMGANKPKG